MNTAHYPSLELCKKLTDIGFLYNNAHTGAITEMLEDRIGYINDRVEYDYLKYEVLPQVRLMEEAQQKKAKEFNVSCIKRAREQENKRIVGILEEMKNIIKERHAEAYENKIMDSAEIAILKEAIERISNKFI